MSRAVSLLMGFLTGAVLGAALGLLLAPASGRQLREEAREYVEGMKREVEEAAQKRRQELELQLANLRGEIRSE